MPNETQPPYMRDEDSADMRPELRDLLRLLYARPDVPTCQVCRSVPVGAYFIAGGRMPMARIIRCVGCGPLEVG